MQHERWFPGPAVDLRPVAGDVGENFRAMREFAGVVVVVWDTGSAGVVMRIRHGLGCVPRGVRVINAVVPAGTGGPLGWYREEGDGDWTREEVVLRWTVSGAAVVLEII